MKLSNLTDGTLDLLKDAGAYLSDLTTPTLRLGVTGLARAGKTVLITALVRNLVAGGRLPFFGPVAEGRVLRAYLEPQPDDAVPRFDYEAHVARLAASPPAWPDSTRQIAQLRITVEYVSRGLVRGRLGASRLHIDIVDYPGEWLIDLGLLDLSFEEWGQSALADARLPHRAAAAAPWLAALAALDPSAPQDETLARRAADAFTAYLAASRRAEPAAASLGPGRFLMPGDLAGSPLLTFAPLDLPTGWRPPRGTLAAMMARRYESYKAHVVKPFFRDHFARLDRQIVLVDVLAAFNAGPDAVAELSRALEMSLKAFRPGAGTWLAAILPRRIDRVLYAATKADHLPQSSHDRLEAILARLTERASARVRGAGADVRVQAIAALRATREAEARQGRETLACIVGVPLAGEQLDQTVFDGRREAAIFPGDLPADPETALAVQRPGTSLAPAHFVRFRPPALPAVDMGILPAPWPHVRLDRALDFLIADWMS